MLEKISTTFRIEDKRKRIALAILLFVMGIFLSISFSSFFFTWENDQSELLNKNAFEVLFSNNNAEDPALAESIPSTIQNKAGDLGAIVSKKFIHDWFGIGSFALIFVCFYLMLRLMNIWTNSDGKRCLFIPISLMIMSSLVFGFFANDAFDGNLGGCFGYYFGILLSNILGKFITGLLIVAITITYIIFTFKKSLPFFSQKIQNLKTTKATTQEEVAETEETQEEEIETPNEIIGQQTEYQPNIDGQKEPETIDEPSYEENYSKNEEESIAYEPEEPSVREQEEVEDDEEALQESSKLDYEEEVLEEEEVDYEEDESAPEEENGTKKIDGMNIVNTLDGAEDTSDIKTVMQDYDPKADLSNFKQPDESLLKVYDNDKNAVQIDENEQLENKNLIESTLLSFGVEIENISATVGPTITLYEIVPKAGTRITKIQSLEKDIMMSLSALGIRIIAPIPGKGTVGIEVPNKKRQVVSMFSVLNSKAFKESKMELPVALGKTITNEVYMFDLAKMPHLLVAGATGQGKSVGLNAIVTSLLFKKHPSQLKFVLIDPKMVEFTIYSGLERHFMATYPDGNDIIITDCLKVQQTLKSLVQEMEDRYKLLMEAHCRNIIEYNEKFIKRQLNPNKGHKYLCYIVIIIDEFGDFIMQAGKEIETPIARIAQKARAVGMHLILATQRPSVNIITGVIKANVPGRIAFRTASGVDSRTILDEVGAEGLVGMGDLLVSKGGAKPDRVQCAFVDTPEVERIVNFVQKQQGYGEAMQLPEIKDENNTVISSNSSSGDTGALDELFEDAASIVVMGKSGSTSAIQRKFQVGYNRAGRIMDQLEKHQIVGPYNGSKAREVLVEPFALDQILNDLRQKGILKNI